MIPNENTPAKYQNVSRENNLVFHSVYQQRSVKIINNAGSVK
jgi:hypothetical protein